MQGFKEALLLFIQFVQNEFFVLAQFGVGAGKFFDNHSGDFYKKEPFTAEFFAVPDCASYQAAQHIACPHVGRGNRFRVANDKR